MKIVNKLNLPEPFVTYATKNNRTSVEKKYSVTELLLPVREIMLRRAHESEIEQDVSDMIPALFGSAVHAVMEENTEKKQGVYSESSFSAVFGEYTLSGRLDLLNTNEMIVEDYKTCSVNKVIREDFEDWKMQGLMYALLVWLQEGIILRKMKFYALMKDWSKVRSATSTNYPASAVFVWERDIADSDYDYIQKWVCERFKEIDRAIKSNTLPECSEEERWYTGTKYAVYKDASDKKAKIVCDTMQEAEDYVRNKLDGSGKIETRYGEYLKCKYYCDCCKFCTKGDNQ